ncbi:DUF2336 domain-containing protein [Terrihabitans sp. B22-R8]|uniref:DUF2336 domain-containing protein n=1 Tax=Terrihabitans sp. B22-R8 TaxID=3425128 RepID=UPI00403C4B0C
MTHSSVCTSADHTERPDIVDRFLAWLPSAHASERAEAAGALARAFLYSDLSDTAYQAAECALTLLMDDSSPDVRRSIAEVFARSEQAPRNLVFVLAHDVSEVALPVLVLSPVLQDADLAEIFTTRGEQERSAIAARTRISEGLARLIAEHGSVDVCTILARNPESRLSGGAFAFLAQRHAADDSLRAALLERDDLSLTERHLLVMALAERFGVLAVDQFGMTHDRARRMSRDNCDRAALHMSEIAGEEVADLLAHLRACGHLTAALMLEAVAGGNLAFVGAALSELTGQDADRVRRMMDDPMGAGFRALHRDAGLPRSSLTIFQQALLGWGETGRDAASAQDRRAVAERSLAEAPSASSAYSLLNRMAAEAAREIARDSRVGARPQQLPAAA